MFLQILEKSPLALKKLEWIFSFILTGYWEPYISTLDYLRIEIRFRIFFKEGKTKNLRKFGGEKGNPVKKSASLKWKFKS